MTSTLEELMTQKDILAEQKKPPIWLAHRKMRFVMKHNLRHANPGTYIIPKQYLMPSVRLVVITPERNFFFPHTGKMIEADLMINTGIILYGPMPTNIKEVTSPEGEKELIAT